MDLTQRSGNCISNKLNLNTKDKKNEKDIEERPNSDLDKNLSYTLLMNGFIPLFENYSFLVCLFSNRPRLVTQEFVEDSIDISAIHKEI